MSTDTLQELLAELKAHPDGSDLLITAFYTAAYHYRRSTICLPFPSEVFSPTPDTKDKDFLALQRALSAVPPVHSLLGGDDVLRGLPPQTLATLKWLLLHPARRRRFDHVALGELVRQLRQRAGGAGAGAGAGGWQLPAFAGHNSPAYVLRAHDGHSQEPFPHGAVAYHGTHLENLHSIVHTGLQSGSGTRLQRTGANFGSGIYLSTNYETAFSFCQPCPSWPRSRFGTKLRVLLVCEVDLDKVSAERGAEAAAAAAAAGGSASTAGTVSVAAPSSSAAGAATTPSTAPSTASSGSGALSSSLAGLPDTYLLVQRTDAVRLLYVLVFADATAVPTGRPARINWCTVMVVLYAAFLVGKALLAALRQHRY